MERAARVFKKSKYSNSILSEDAMLTAIWPTAVGKAIASHTLRLRVVRNTLLVEVEDVVWQRQLYPLTSQILQRIRTITGSDAIEDIEFRIGIPRLQPQRAETRDHTLFAGHEPSDEAERIADPVLKKVYRLSRKKATA